MLWLPGTLRAPLVLPPRRRGRVFWNRALTKAIEALGQFEREDWRRGRHIPDSLVSFGFPLRFAKKNSPGCDCCAAGCTLLDDNYDRADSTNIGANWTELAGDARIEGNLLKTDDANAKIISTVTHSSKKVHISVSVRGDTAGDSARIILAQSDANNYHYAQLKFGSRGTLSLGKVVAGVGSTIAEVDMGTVALATFHSFSACLDTSVFRAVAVGVSLSRTETAPNNGGFGLGTGAQVNGTISFNDFVATKVEAGCQACSPTYPPPDPDPDPICCICQDHTAPQQVELIMPAVVALDNICANCEAFDAATYILDFNEHGGPYPCSCLWLYIAPPGIACGVFGVEFWTQPGEMRADLYPSPPAEIEKSFIIWKRNEAGPINCGTLNHDLPWFAAHTDFQCTSNDDAAHVNSL